MNTAPSRWKIVVMLGAIFAGGLVAGACGMLAIVKHRLHQRGDAARWAETSLRKLDDELHLTPEQRVRVEPALAAMAGNLRRLRTEAWTGWRREFERTVGEIEPMLDPAQRKALDAMRREATIRLAEATDGLPR